MGFDGPFRPFEERERRREEEARRSAEQRERLRQAQEEYKRDEPIRRAREEQERRQYFNNLRQCFYPIITAKTPPIIKVPSLPEEVLLPVDVRAALIQALQSYNRDKVEILIGPQDVKEEAQALFSKPIFHRRFALYSVYLSAVLDYWHSLDEAAKKRAWDEFSRYTDFPTDNSFFLLDKKSLRQAMIDTAEKIGCPLTTYEIQRFTGTIRIDCLNDVYNMDLDFSPSAQYLAHVYRANPVVSLDSQTVEAHCYAYAHSVYQTQVKAYFSRFPEEKVALKSFIVPASQRRLLDAACWDVAWQCYQKANAENKNKALINLTLLWKRLSNTIFPLPPVKVRECEDDWPLLKALFTLYQPKNDRDERVKKVLLTLIEDSQCRSDLSSVVPTLLASSLPWEATFPQKEAAWATAPNQGRSILKDAVYLSIYHGVTRSTYHYYAGYSFNKKHVILCFTIGMRIALRNRQHLR